MVEAADRHPLAETRPLPRITETTAPIWPVTDLDTVTQEAAAVAIRTENDARPAYDLMVRVLAGLRRL